MDLALVSDLYAHASDKWDVFGRPVRRGIRAGEALLSISAPPAVFCAHDSVARHPHGKMMIPADPSRKQSCEKRARDIQGRHPDVSCKEDLKRPLRCMHRHKAGQRAEGY